mmetsp:Transcript_20301/g.67759  ORF Transcript_20301/g.67759 Transcript_20301/m.67759 type:complete len:93 (+) Transcript_20301:793-1071(+)
MPPPRPESMASGKENSSFLPQQLRGRRYKRAEETRGEEKQQAEGQGVEGRWRVTGRGGWGKGGGGQGERGDKNRVRICKSARTVEVSLRQMR